MAGERLSAGCRIRGRGGTSCDSVRILGVYDAYARASVDELAAGRDRALDAERILPEISEPLGAYALRKLRTRGIGFRLGETGARDARHRRAGRRGVISTRTVVWTAGTRPNRRATRAPRDSEKVSVESRARLVVGEHALAADR